MRSSSSARLRWRSVTSRTALDHDPGSTGTHEPGGRLGVERRAVGTGEARLLHFRVARLFDQRRIAAPQLVGIAMALDPRGTQAQQFGPLITEHIVTVWFTSRY